MTKPYEQWQKLYEQWQKPFKKWQKPHKQMTQTIKKTKSEKQWKNKIQYKEYNTTINTWQKQSKQQKQ